MIGPRLDHKLAYAMQNTDVQIRFYHKNQEPPLETYGVAGRSRRVLFQRGRLAGHDHGDGELPVPLLPGPGRLLARYVVGPSGTDKVASAIQKQGGVYTYPLQAAATIGNEGEKSVVTYVYP